MHIYCFSFLKVVSLKHVLSHKLQSSSHKIEQPWLRYFYCVLSYSSIIKDEFVTCLVNKLRVQHCCF